MRKWKINLTPFFIALFLATSAYGAAGKEASKSTADASPRELANIMKDLKLVPQVGKTDPFCKVFYEDFTKQTNIEHIQPSVAAESYDDPEFKPYRDKCPKLDFRLSRHAHTKDAGNWSQKDWETLGTPSYGIGNFRLYRLGLDPSAKERSNIVFYYEGERILDRRIPIGSSTPVEKEIMIPELRAYQVIDLRTCDIGAIVQFNQFGSEKWTHNGVIKYKGTNAIYILKSYKSEKPEYSELELDAYSEKLKRVAPRCAYVKPR